ncbi:uncharacterized protein PFL1_03965 [Pseudozyma flocculosa PF-1]|uniref:DUF985 domain-containing protein n=2 Tax=Pseudozyma flocculosa TaxID=84751 RepID=A0A5C3F035_9BASI|nr:uncharacterized protein PFL1_03965 [Pseudozyma flocculosa PF-1]EPQ28662.1 hypothetical protein PFL1_03965 [Pseudozyma flocculosa PF-1]SPO36611.1 uncharacterized protein PSFLO_02082 [Pseudozyma flocculosa]
MKNPARLYSYPQTNKQLIDHYKLQPHPEGGYYALTWVQDETIPSPFATDKAERNIASVIYYLLCQPGPSLPGPPTSGDDAKLFQRWNADIGVFHLNKSATMHVHHAGRTRYTLISAKAPLGKGLVDERGLPLTRVVTMGEDFERGEVRQLLVEGGWWKVSEVPPEDRRAVEERSADPQRVGALITECVTPGFHWDDHTYLNVERLKDLFAGPHQDEHVEKYRQYVKDE